MTIPQVRSSTESAGASASWRAVAKAGRKIVIDHVVFKGSMRARVDHQRLEQLPLPELPQRDRAALSLRVDQSVSFGPESKSCLCARGRREWTLQSSYSDTLSR
jgi:hypothetical protein